LKIDISRIAIVLMPSMINYLSESTKSSSIESESHSVCKNIHDKID